MSHTWVALVTRFLNVLGVFQCLSESHVGRDDYSVAQCSCVFQCLSESHVGRDVYSVAQYSSCVSVFE